MKTLATAMLLAVVPAMALAQHGTLEEVEFFSESLGETRSFGLYLPSGYGHDVPFPYPVVYFLHGTDFSTEVYWDFFGMTDTLDQLILNGVIQPTIVVAPDGLVDPFNGSWWTNSELYGAFEDYVVEDLVAYVDEHYHTNPWRRGIMGLSMGGYGAMKIAMKHPDRFPVVASHSGVVGTQAYLEAILPDILAEVGGPPYVYDPEAGVFNADLFSMSGAWSPDLDNPPWLLDLPIDEDGDLIPEVLDRWHLEDPFYLAADLDPDALDIFFDCGTMDEYLLHDVNVDFTAVLDGLGIPYVFESFEGMHFDRFHERFPIGVTFIDGKFREMSEGFGGTVETPSFHSAALDDMREITVYLPHGYDPDGDVEYPVAYYLHGYDSYEQFPWIPSVLDSVIADRPALPFIWVKPEGNGRGAYIGPWWTNSVVNGDYEDYVVEDVIAYVESTYRTLAIPEARVIMGHSMGALGAMKIYLTHPELFAGVASHSGALDLATMAESIIPYCLAEHGGTVPYDFHPDAGFVSEFLFSFAAAFSPNPDNPPYHVDFILDENGEVIESVWDRWMAHSPSVLAADLPPATRERIFFDCGDANELLAYAPNLAFNDVLDGLGLDHVWQSVPGGGHDLTPPRLRSSLTYLVERWMAWTVEVPEIGGPTIGPRPPLPCRVGPNPTRGAAWVEFRLEGSAPVDLGIYDVVGRRILDRSFGTLGAGIHRRTVDTAALPGGVYWCRVTTASAAATRRLVIDR